MIKKTALRFSLLALAVSGACSEETESHCIGEPVASGEWQVLGGAMGDGQPCTTPAGDLHVRYEQTSSDELVTLWSNLIPERLELQEKEPWGASREYRQGYYQAEDGNLLNVSVVQTGSTRVRTVRLTWE